ncbi:MAG TPA: hydroxymethylbilane synthase [Tepidisphaeraceae bacterium]|jgi:hydroxymethylbilane synthase
MSEPIVIRLGTRGSLLARTQSQQVADSVMRATPGVRVELVILKTTGDRVQDRPLADLGGKGLFTKELEQALLAGTVDFAVHSYKDVPVTMPLVDASELAIVAVPPREDARDVLVTRGGAASVACLPPSAKVGTGSLRRKCQLLAQRTDLIVEGVRGNIDTRLRKLEAGEFDAIVLAAAGLKRAGLYNPASMTLLDPTDMVPSPGQGALAIQCRRDDVHTIGLLRALHDPVTERCVNVERQVVQALNGDCHSPIAAYAVERQGRIVLRIAVGGTDGAGPVRRALQDKSVAEAGLLAEMAIGDLA